MSSEIKVSSVKAKDGTAGISIADSTGNVSLSGSLSAGTIGDDVNLSNKYYLRLDLANSFSFPSEGRYINTSGTTDPYFTLTGDTTNLTSTNTNHIKVIRKGIYLITFSGTFSFGSTSVARAVNVFIRGGTSVNPTTNITSATDQIASTVSGSDYGSATCTFVGELPANYYLRFYSFSTQAGEAQLHSQTHANIILIRPTA